MWTVRSILYLYGKGYLIETYVWTDRMIRYDWDIMFYIIGVFKLNFFLIQKSIRIIHTTNKSLLTFIN